MARDRAEHNETEDDDSANLELYKEPEVGAPPAELAAYSFGRWMVQRDTYEGKFKQWARAILFLLGKQWLEWDERSKRYAPEQNVPKWRQRPVTNLVFAVYRASLAKLTKQKPALDCIPPQNGDSDDRAAAAIGDALLHYLWRFLQFGKTLGKGIGWLLTCGNIYVEVYWNTEGGKAVPLTTVIPQQNELTGEVEEAEVAADDNGDPVLGDDGKPDLTAEPRMIFEGEVGNKLISPLSVRFNPGCTDIDEATEYFIGDLAPVAEVCAMYDLDPDDIKLNEDDSLEEFEDLIASSSGADTILGIIQPTTGAGRDQVIGDRALVLRYYRKPCDDYPKGRHWVTVNREPVLDPDSGEFEQELPDGFWPPIVAIQDVPVPGQVDAMGLIGQCVSLNREYNDQNGKIKEHNVTMARGGKWIVTQADKNLAITTDPGQKLVSDGYLMGMPPVQARMEGLPAQVYEERQRILNDLFLVSGVNEVAMGQTPEGVTAGRAFLVMQEATDAVLGPTLASIEIAAQEIGRRWLELTRRHVSEERIVKIRGAMGQWEIRSFTGADLGDGIDVQVQLGSSFPWSKSARLDTVLSAISALPGLVSDPTTGAVDHVKFARLTDIGGLQAFAMEGDADLIEVQMENAQFEQFNPDTGTSEIPQPGFWQNHNVHFEKHSEVLKRDRTRFERWHPVAQKAFIDHLLYHLQAVTQGAAAMMPQQPPPTDPNAAPTDPNAPPPQQGGAVTSSPGTGDQQLTRADFAAAGQ